MTEQLLDVMVARRTAPAQGIVILDLVDSNGAALPRFEPGAHVDLHLGPGLVRQYSLCGDPSDRSHYRLGILLAPTSRGGSAAVHAALQTGDRLRIGTPRNHFPLARDAAQSVLIGGGIGITPLLAMAHQCIADGNAFMLHYCARERACAAFLDVLQAEPFRAHAALHFDSGEPSQRFDPKRDLPPPAVGTHLYVCGPAGFMDWVIAEARRLGHDQALIHREYFQAEVDAGSDSFAVVLARRGTTVTVPAGVPITKALAEANIKIEVSCEQGICGTCVCQVLEGVPDHRDKYLTDDEKSANDQMMLCCSRSKSPTLVLDL